MTNRWKVKRSHYRSTSLVLVSLDFLGYQIPGKKITEVQLRILAIFFSCRLKSPSASFGLIVSTGNFLICRAISRIIIQELETVVSRGCMSFLIGKLFDNHRKSSARLNLIALFAPLQFGLVLLNCKSYQYDKESMWIVFRKPRDNCGFKRFV